MNTYREHSASAFDTALSVSTEVFGDHRYYKTLSMTMSLTNHNRLSFFNQNTKIFQVWVRKL